MGQLASGAPHTVRMRRRTQQPSTQRKLPRRPELPTRAARAARARSARCTARDLGRGQNHHGEFTSGDLVNLTRQRGPQTALLLPVLWEVRVSRTLSLGEMSAKG